MREIVCSLSRLPRFAARLRMLGENWPFHSLITWLWEPGLGLFVVSSLLANWILRGEEMNEDEVGDAGEEGDAGKVGAAGEVVDAGGAGGRDEDEGGEI